MTTHPDPTLNTTASQVAPVTDQPLAELDAVLDAPVHDNADVTLAARVAALLAEPYADRTARRARDRAAESPDLFNQAVNLFQAALAEWGVGDERTSEAVRLRIVAADRTDRPMAPRHRADLVRTHLLDDLCPVHLLDGVMDHYQGARVCPECSVPTPAR